MPKSKPTIQKIFTLPPDLNDKFVALARFLDVSQTELFRQMVRRATPGDLVSHNFTLPMTPGERASVIQDMRRRPDAIPLDPADPDIPVRGPHVAAPAGMIPQTLAQAPIPVFQDDEHTLDDETFRGGSLLGEIEG